MVSASGGRLGDVALGVVEKAAPTEIILGRRWQNGQYQISSIDLTTNNLRFFFFS